MEEKGNQIEKKDNNVDVVKPSVEYLESYITALREYHKEGIYLNQKEEDVRKNFSNIISELNNESSDPSKGHISYFIVDKDGYAGKVSLEYAFNEQTKKKEGYIGYNVIPSKREKGYGGEALALTLYKARLLGLKTILLTCLDTNIASKKIIEKNGGVLQRKEEERDGKRNILTYFINL